MTQPDAVANAPVEERHRVEAVRAYGLEAPESSMLYQVAADWLEAHERGIELRIGIITDTLKAFAQSLANLEAAVRREYSELQHLAASAARMLRDGDERDVSGRIFKELETLKNG